MPLRSLIAGSAITIGTMTVLAPDPAAAEAGHRHTRQRDRAAGDRTFGAHPRLRRHRRRPRP